MQKKESPQGKESHISPLQAPVLIHCELVVLQEESHRSSTERKERREARRAELAWRSVRICRVPLNPQRSPVCPLPGQLIVRFPFASRPMAQALFGAAFWRAMSPPALTELNTAFQLSCSVTARLPCIVQHRARLWDVWLVGCVGKTPQLCSCSWRSSWCRGSS